MILNTGTSLPPSLQCVHVCYMFTKRDLIWFDLKMYDISYDLLWGLWRYRTNVLMNTPCRSEEPPCCHSVSTTAGRSSGTDFRRRRRTWSCGRSDTWRRRLLPSCRVPARGSAAAAAAAGDDDDAVDSPRSASSPTPRSSRSHLEGSCGGRTTITTNNIYFKYITKYEKERGKTHTVYASQFNATQRGSDTCLSLFVCPARRITVTI